MTTDPRATWLEDFERRHDVPPDTYCGLSPAEMSRVIVAWNAGPTRPGAPVGYDPVGAPDTRLGWLRAEFGDGADVERLRLLEQVFGARVARALALDWMLPSDAFGRAVGEGLRRHFPELTEEARRVIAGNYDYSHAK